MSGATMDVKKFETLVYRRGRYVKWQEAIMCSCWNMDSGQPADECKACNGIGYVYEDPVEERVLLMSITHNKEFNDMAGVFETGDAVMTIPKRVPKILPNGQLDNTFKNHREHLMFNAGMHDLITVMDDTYRTSEVLHKGVPMYGRPADTLLNEDVTKIIKVRKYDRDTGNRTDYREGIDFSWVTNKIDWLGNGNEPLEGEQYSVVYEHRPVFTVLTTLPTQRYQDDQHLPRKLALRYRAGGLR